MTNSTAIEKAADHAAVFEALRHTDDLGDFWLARELMTPLGYASWQKFEDVIARAIVAFKANEEDPTKHINHTDKMVEVGSGAHRAVKDYRLTRYGAYAVVQGADPRKPEIAAAWAYFRIQTRKAEAVEMIAVQQETRSDWLHRGQHVTRHEVMEQTLQYADRVARYYEIFKDDLTPETRREAAEYLVKLPLGLTKARADVERALTSDDNVIGITAYLTDRGVPRRQRVKWTGTFGARVHALYKEEYGREAPVGQKVLGAAGRAGRVYVEKDRRIIDAVFAEFVALGRFTPITPTQREIAQ